MTKIPEEQKPPPAFNMAAPNKDLIYRGQLKDLQLPEPKTPSGLNYWAFRESGSYDSWMNPTRLEEMLEADPEVQRLGAAVLAVLGTKAEAKAIKALDAAVNQVFEKQALIDIVLRFDQVRPLVTEYAVTMAIRQAARDLNLKERSRG